MSAYQARVAIVGGGPAGSSAAHTLAMAGIEVCLVDRSVFPRDKLCGGLLTLRSQKIFQRVFQTSWNPVIQANSRGVMFFYREKPLKSLFDYKDLFFTCRKKYDAYLLDLARRSGTIVIEGKTAQAVNLQESILTLSDGASLHYEYLIGADGVNSMVAKALFGDSFDKSTIGFGLEMEVPISSEVPAITNPEIYFGLLKWGYGWVFPKHDTLTVGVGGLLGSNLQMRANFEEFLRQRFGRVPAQKIKGHFIPFGDFRRRPGQGNVMLCGDAAGLVEPITGEGIAFAMLSGYYAAESIKEAVLSGQPGAATDLYEKRYAAIASSFQQAHRLRRLLFPGPCQFFFSKILARSESIPRRHMDLMADELSYEDYARFLLQKVWLGPLKKLGLST